MVASAEQHEKHLIAKHQYRRMALADNCFMNMNGFIRSL
jgi:hypothetical protein